MRLETALLTMLLACLIGPTAGTGQEPPIFDAHLHYNQADWAVYSPEAILAGLRDRLRRGIYRGIGEFHLTAAQAGDPVVRGLAELSLKSEVAPEGRLDPGWRALLLRHPDRFLVGTDTYVTSQWARLPALQTWTRAWLAQLPREAAARLAHGNARALLGLP